MKTQIVGLNDYTDGKEWEMIIRKIDNLVWGFYRDANHKGTISDSQFTISQANTQEDWTQEEIDALKDKFGFYYTDKEEYTLF